MPPSGPDPIPIAGAISPSGDPSPREALALYASAHAQARRLALRWVDGDTAEDIAQEVGWELYQRIERDGPSAVPQEFENWIRRAVWQAAVTFHEANRRNYRRDYSAQVKRERAISEWSDPAAAHDLRELKAVLGGAVAAMPPAMREVFLLLVRDGFSYAETGAKAGIAEGTVHTQMKRALQLLRRAIAIHEGEPQ